MRSAKEIYQIWAPPASVWSEWVAPVLFTELHCAESAPELDDLPGDINWMDLQSDGQTTIVLDLPGDKCVRFAMALSRQGFRPVPLFNASPGPPQSMGLSDGMAIYSHSAVEMSALIEAFCRATTTILQTHIPPGAPPVFMLDSVRLRGTFNRLGEGLFDNRWMVFPQDFPSARFLMEHKIRRALLVQDGNRAPQEDLAHVLLRWQEAGIEIYSKSLAEAGAASRFKVTRPSRFRMAWYRALAMMGFRRNSAGGFGSVTPTFHGGGG